MTQRVALLVHPPLETLARSVSDLAEPRKRWPITFSCPRATKASALNMTAPLAGIRSRALYRRKR